MSNRREPELVIMMLGLDARVLLTVSATGMTSDMSERIELFEGKGALQV
jgi:hypothetical protein